MARGARQRPDLTGRAGPLARSFIGHYNASGYEPLAHFLEARNKAELHPVLMSVVTLQTFGDLVNFHPHGNTPAADGVFHADGQRTRASCLRAASTILTAGQDTRRATLSRAVRTRRIDFRILTLLSYQP